MKPTNQKKKKHHPENEAIATRLCNLFQMLQMTVSAQHDLIHSESTAAS